MVLLNNYGYAEGLLSNSMVQLAQFCTEQFVQKYIERKKPVEGGEELVEATTMGSLVHMSLEKGTDGAYDEFYRLCSGMIGEEQASKLRSLINQTMVAIDSVHASGKQYGRVYTAPRMTGHWQKNYGYIDDSWADFSKELDGIGYNWGKYAPIDFFTDAYRCVSAEKYAPVVPEGASCQREQEVQTNFYGSDMVGSIDVLMDGHIVDYKTGRKEWSELDVLDSDQFNLYTWMLRKQSGWSDVQVTVRDLRRNTSVTVHIPEDQSQWERRYRQKVAFASLLLKGNLPRGLILPYGSGFHPGCPCQIGCKWI